MTEKLGYNNLLVMMAYAVEMGETAAIVYEDGKISVGDLGAMVSLYKATTDLGNIDFKMVMPELKDLDPEELKDICDMVKDRFNLKDKDVEQKVKHMLDLTSELFTCIKRSMALVKELTGEK